MSITNVAAFIIVLIILSDFISLSINKKCMRKTLLLSLIFFSLEVMASYDAGRAAYARGNYNQAYKLWLEVANVKTGSIDNYFEWTRPSNELQRNAQYSIAVLYCLGKGVKQNYHQAVKWLELAVNAGHIQAHLKLAFFNLQGKGVKKNKVMARKYFRVAAEHGFVDAQFNMGVMYLKGDGGEKSLIKAKYWLKKAALQGDEDAFEELKNIQERRQVKSEQLEIAAIEKQMINQSEVNVSSESARIHERTLISQSESQNESQASRIDSLEKKYNVKNNVYKRFILHEPKWLLKQEKNKYALQIMALGSLEKLKNFTRINIIENEWAYFIKVRGNKRYYVLLRCCFPNKQLANKAKTKFPAEIKNLQSFPVRLKQIHKYVLYGQ